MIVERANYIVRSFLLLEAIDSWRTYRMWRA